VMARKILAVAAGLAVWVAVATVAGVIMRGAWREYANVADAMAFTPAMMLARLAIGGVATLAGGWVTAVVAYGSMPAILTTGVLLLGMFVPQHIRIWDKFPVWYHLTFLVSLVPLTYIGGNMTTARVKN
jgi:hypothetical protein